MAWEEGYDIEALARRLLMLAEFQGRCDLRMLAWKIRGAVMQMLENYERDCEGGLCAQTATQRRNAQRRAAIAAQRRAAIRLPCTQTAVEFNNY